MRPTIEEQIAELRAMLAQLLNAQATPQAVKRSEAARLMGVRPRKLEALIASGKVATAAEDVRLVPMAEIRRYCAPKVARQRKPSVGVRASRRPAVDTQSEEAIAELKARLRSKGRA